MNAFDVPTDSEALEQLRRMRDLAIVEHISDRVAVMFRGRIAVRRRQRVGGILSYCYRSAA
jgi:ABC-type dipeptide/oligopeptide/nickel transport system ATPase subunit